MFIELNIFGVGPILVNLNHVESISITPRAPESVYVTYYFNDGANGSLGEKFSSFEEAEERYNEIKRMLIGEEVPFEELTQLGIKPEVTE